MDSFVYDMAISYHLLFLIISGAIYLYLKEPCFKHYAFYNIFLVVYVISRNSNVYLSITNYASGFLGAANATVFVHVVFFYVQITFYTFYVVFALYFLDLNVHAKKYFKRVTTTLKILALLMFLSGLISYYIKDTVLLIDVFSFIYLPTLLYMFIATLLYAKFYTAEHRKFFVIGICSFVIFGLVSFIGSTVEALQMEDPLNYFYIGVTVETLFFSLSLAHKLKLLNDEKVRTRREMVKNKYRGQLSKFHGLLEGEERERKRLAEELHDGIAGDLAAIKYNLNILKKDSRGARNDDLVEELTQIIDKSYTQIREITHNLSPAIVTNKGLVAALEQFCLQNRTMHGIDISLRVSGKRFTLGKLAETHLYRIIQELVTNIVKHASAKHAIITLWHHSPYLTVVVRDDGIGFSQNGDTSGIGLSNIESRIRFLNAEIKSESNSHGSRFDIEIDLQKVPHG